MKVALSIAGFDPTGGAGVVQDVRTMATKGVWCVTAITAITVQDSNGVHRVEPLDPELVRDQIERLRNDSAIVAVKTGMLATRQIIEVVAKSIEGIEHVVVDPVLRSGNDQAQLSDLGALRELLLPRSSLITPNANEAHALTGVFVESVDTQRTAARMLTNMGASAALVKGGHIDGPNAIDVLDDGTEVTELKAPRINGGRVHGTGCTLSAAITANLALGLDLTAAVEDAKKIVTKAIRNAARIGAGDAFAQPAR